ncbi:amidohydrolase family protein [Virgisporangium ochraceum]|uniref:Hydrolase n=1 Tax=Virgisporangium ochraceum TaxID=65505 RepID=A0A8J3ZX01_9ACTN|nr:amidohydrolase family protein [Virgisporangium ochraceum]GIJ71146.1 hydrolase [Virgisporangium ochraceum]
MRRLLFTNGTVFDGTGAPPAPADVVVEGDRIVAVGIGLDGDDAVDCTGRTILPGLIDSHVHLMIDGLDPLGWLHDPFSLQFYRAATSMRKTLDVGITTVRDAGGADLGVREAQRRGLVKGPRVQIAISMLSQTGGHGDPWAASGCHVPIFVPHPGRPAGVVDGTDEARRKVRELVRAGADVIKIATSGGVVSARDDPRHGHFRDAEVAVIVEEATSAGIPVMAHAAATDGIKTAVRAGVRSIEHGIFLDDEAVELMVENKAWLVPTLIAPHGVVRAAEAGAAISEHVLEKAHLVIRAHRESVRRAIEAGVRIAFGTDTGVTPHGRNLDELALLVECGLTPAQALRAATREAAQLLGTTDLGTVEPGKIADLVLVDGDLSEVDTLAERVRAVYQGGVEV